MSAPVRWKHVMVDIETMGTDRDAAVLAIGVVPFNLHREACLVALPFEMWVGRTSLAANLALGRAVDGSTIEWWLRQSDAARAALLVEPRYLSVHQMASSLRSFLVCGLMDPDLHVWAKPPQFDLEILRSLFKDVVVDWPCSRRLERDSRPLLDLAKLNGWDECFPSPTVEHGALEDAVEQAEQVVRIYRRINGWPAP